MTIHDIDNTEDRHEIYEIMKDEGFVAALNAVLVGEENKIKDANTPSVNTEG